MTLEKLDNILPNITALIMYTPSASLQLDIRKKLKEKFKVHPDFIVNVNNQRELHNAKVDAYASPLFCDYWLIHVDADEFSKNDIAKEITHRAPNGIVVYWITQYRQFMQFTNNADVKKQSVNFPTFSLSRLDRNDLEKILEDNKPNIELGNALNRDLTLFVCKNYRYDVEAVYDLTALLKTGAVFETKQDIIESIGSGGMTVDGVVFRILEANPKVVSSRKKMVRDIFQSIKELSYSYTYSNIRKFMLTTIKGCIEMKQLQVMGLYNRPYFKIPAHYDEKAIQRLKRFEDIILNEITLPKLLTLQLCLLRYNGFNAEIALVQAISEYYNTLEVEPNKKRTAKPKLSKEEQQIAKVLKAQEEQLETVRAIRLEQQEDARAREQQAYREYQQQQRAEAIKQEAQRRDNMSQEEVQKVKAKETYENAFDLLKSKVQAKNPPKPINPTIENNPLKGYTGEGVSKKGLSNHKAGDKTTPVPTIASISATEPTTMHRTQEEKSTHLYSTMEEYFKANLASKM